MVSEMVYGIPLPSQVKLSVALSGPLDCGLKITPRLQDPPPDGITRSGVQGLVGAADSLKLDASVPEMVADSRVIAGLREISNSADETVVGDPTGCEPKARGPSEAVAPLYALPVRAITLEVPAKPSELSSTVSVPVAVKMVGESG